MYLLLYHHIITLLIFFASSSLRPSEPDLISFSEPARSTSVRVLLTTLKLPWHAYKRTHTSNHHQSKVPTDKPLLLLLRNQNVKVMSRVIFFSAPVSSPTVCIHTYICIVCIFISYFVLFIYHITYIILCIYIWGGGTTFYATGGDKRINK